MRKTEFMDLLKYYFRKEDKGDLKGILIVTNNFASVPKKEKQKKKFVSN